MPDDPSPIVGLGTLDALKAAVLPAGLAAQATFDAQLSAIGKSVAAQFDAFCSRKFVRTEGATWDGTADRVFVSLPCYPVEQVSKIEVRFYGQSSDGTFIGAPTYDDLTDAVVGTVDQLAGLLDLQYPQGAFGDRLRITYTGGYWIDPGDGSPMPDTATPLPGDLFSAWTLQVGTELQARDVLGIGVVRDEKQGAPGYAAGLRLTPAVRDILSTYRRMAIS